MGRSKPVLRAFSSTSFWGDPGLVTLIGRVGSSCSPLAARRLGSCAFRAFDSEDKRCTCLLRRRRCSYPGGTRRVFLSVFVQVLTGCDTRVSETHRKTHKQDQHSLCSLKWPFSSLEHLGLDAACQVVHVSDHIDTLQEDVGTNLYLRGNSLLFGKNLQWAHYWAAESWAEEQATTEHPCQRNVTHLFKRLFRT